MARRCEVWTDGHGWRAYSFAALAVGMVFRLFEEATDARVMDEDGTWRWRVLGAPQVGGDGPPTIEAEPVPETEVERAVRTEGFYWPGDRARGDGNRLR